MSSDLSGIVGTGTNAIVSVAYAGAVMKTTERAFGVNRKRTKKSKKRSIF